MIFFQTFAEARKCVDTWSALGEGRRVSSEDFEIYSNTRVFFIDSQKKAQCTCPAFAFRGKECLHSISLMVRAGLREWPDALAETPLTNGLRGRKRKPGDRYSVQHAGNRTGEALVVAAQLRKRLRTKTRDQA